MEPVLESLSETSLANQKNSSKVKMVCHNCGSDNITSDATVRWNVDIQDWKISGIFDSKNCEDCGYEKNYCDVFPIENEENLMTSEQRIQDLLNANNRYMEMNRLLRRQLQEDRNQFAFYAKEHESKAANFAQQKSSEAVKASLKKAAINTGFVVNIDTVLDATNPR